MENNVQVGEEVEADEEGEEVVEEEEEEEEDYVLPTKRSKKKKSKGTNKEGASTKTKQTGGPKVSQSMKKEIMSMAWAAIHQNGWKCTLLLSYNRSPKPCPNPDDN